MALSQDLKDSLQSGILAMLADPDVAQLLESHGVTADDAVSADVSNSTTGTDTIPL